LFRLGSKLASNKAPRASAIFTGTWGINTSEGEEIRRERKLIWEEFQSRMIYAVHQEAQMECHRDSKGWDTAKLTGQRA
jgi:hypothetical protein